MSARPGWGNSPSVVAYHPSCMAGVALIVAGGARPDPLEIKALPAIDFCVAADSGADSAIAVNLAVDSIVGDLDSISPTTLAALRDAGAEIREHAAEKDQTDLELAFARVMEEQPDRVIVIGIGGGRIDHALANIAVLAAQGRGGVIVDGLVGSARLSVVRGTRSLDGALGETISLLPVLGRADGVTTEGLKYPLADEPLEPGSARGVSNRFVAPLATVSVQRGVLLAVQPFALSERSRG